MTSISSKGFSLLELLVVIAIIAILAALLLPAITRSKDQAAKAADLSNLHQVTVAVNLYTGDNNEVLTWPNWDYGGAASDGTARAGWLYQPNLSAAGTNVFNSRAGQLWNFLHGGKVLLCPMDQPDQLYHHGPHKVVERDQQLSTYIMNGAVIGFRSGYQANVQPVKISQMQPGDCLLFEADERSDFSYNDGSSWPAEGISTRHSKGATQGAMDGSSSYVRDADWLGDLQCPTKNRLWCNPNTADGGDVAEGHITWNWSF